MLKAVSQSVLRPFGNTVEWFFWTITHANKWLVLRMYYFFVGVLDRPKSIILLSTLACLITFMIFGNTQKNCLTMCIIGMFTHNLKIAVQHIQHTTKKTYVQCALMQVGQVTFGTTLNCPILSFTKRQWTIIKPFNHEGLCQIKTVSHLTHKLLCSQNTLLHTIYYHLLHHRYAKPL